MVFRYDDTIATVPSPGTESTNSSDSDSTTHGSVDDDEHNNDDDGVDSDDVNDKKERDKKKITQMSITRYVNQLLVLFFNYPSRCIFVCVYSHSQETSRF